MVAIKDSDVWYVKDRIQKMESERQKLEWERQTAEQQYDAPTYVDNEGKIIYNSKIESTLVEQHIGRLSNQIYWDMKPEQQADAQEVFAAKAITDYFLEKEWFYRQLSIRDHSKSIYGIWIRYTGISLDIEKKYKPKEWAEVESTDTSGWVEDDDLFEEYTQYNWSFTPKNVSPREFLWDDRYFWQPDWSLAEDCARVEYISKDKLKERRGEDKKYDIEWLEPTTHTDKSGTKHNETIKITHYYNKNNKDYIILGNNECIIRATKMKYKDGKLPFEVCQHYPDNKCIAGKGIPYKVRATKGYINNMRQAALDKAWSSAFANIVLGKNNVLNNKYTVGGWVNIWEMNSASDFQQFQANGDINGIVAMNEMLMEDIRSDTGEDPRASFESPESTLWQTEIVEENKAIRLKALQISRDICLDNAITAAYHNIQQFAPVVLRKTEKVKVWDKEVDKVVRPVIWLPWIKVTKKWGKQELEQTMDYGEAGWYELNPKYRMIDWVAKVVTNSSYNKQGSVLEKNKFTEFTNNLMTMAQIFWPELIQKYPVDKVLEYMDQAYWYDADKQFASTTKKDKIRQKNMKLIEEMKAKFSWGGLLPSLWWQVVQTNPQGQLPQTPAGMWNPQGAELPAPTGSWQGTDDMQDLW